MAVRSRSWVEDGRFEPGPLTLPAPRGPGLTRLLVVFGGRVAVCGLELADGDAAVLGADVVGAEAEALSDLVLFTTDEQSPCFEGGMFSGNTRRLQKAGAKAEGEEA